MATILAFCGPLCPDPHEGRALHVRGEVLADACEAAQVTAIVGDFTITRTFAVMFGHESDWVTFMVGLASGDPQIAYAMARDAIPCEAHRGKLTVLRPEHLGLRERHSVIASFPHVTLTLPDDISVMRIGPDGVTTAVERVATPGTIVQFAARGDRHG